MTLEENVICSEDASLWEKLHNLPYILAHKRIFVLKIFLDFVGRLVLFAVIDFLFLLALYTIITNLTIFSLFSQWGMF